MQKTQNSTIERLIKGKSKDEIKNDAAIKKVIQEQNAQWSEMVEKHKKEEWELVKQQIQDQQETLKKLMEQCQANQVKQLESKHAEREKELNTQQAKISVETAKEIANDKTLKTKGEKDRRLREKKQNNIKRFMEEKKVSSKLSVNVARNMRNLLFFDLQTAQIKQGREREKLKMTHEKQLESLSHDLQKVSDSNWESFFDCAIFFLLSNSSLTSSKWKKLNIT